MAAIADLVKKHISTIVVSTMLILVGVASPASAAEPVAPTQLDRCGTEQDQFIIPVGNPGDAYYINGVYAPPTTYTVSGSYVTITSDGMTSGTWTFSYVNNGACGPEAANTMAVDVRPCNPATGLTEVLVTYTNVADATAWYDSDVYVEAYHKEDTHVSTRNAMNGTLLDGQSVTYDLADPDPSYDNGIDGLTPGTYVFTARHSRGGLATYEARIESCNGNFPFPGTPPTMPGGTSTGKATARIIPGKVVTHTACMDTRKVKGNGRVEFRVDRTTGKKFKVVKRTSLATGSKACYQVRAARGSTLTISVFNPDTGKWDRLARKRIGR